MNADPLTAQSIRPKALVLAIMVGLMGHGLDADAARPPDSGTTLELPPARHLPNTAPASLPCDQYPSVARAWNEQALLAIRQERARPTIHARNLFHLSAAMYDAWAAYVPQALPHFHDEAASGPETSTAQQGAISHAAFQLLYHRFLNSNGAAVTLPALELCMVELGLDPSDQSLEGSAPAAVGNRVAATIIARGLADGANESGNYADYTGYFPVNNPMLVELPWDVGLADRNAWQPLIPAAALGIQSFMTPFWGKVEPFALQRQASGAMYIDPGPPPQLGGTGDAVLKQEVLALIRVSAWLDPDDGAIIDISPSVHGNNELGSDDGQGHVANPITGKAYPPNLVARGDWGRVIAEFWADGPASSTPPGHWNELANAVVDHPDFQRRLGGQGPTLQPLEWDVKFYLALNGALHDAGMATWEVKYHYNSIRPISLIREMGALGQSSDPDQPAWHPLGLPLEPGLVELVSSESSAPGQRHEHLANHVGEVAVLSWAGHPQSPETEYAGTAWIRAVNWLPYQRRDFVTPPFAGYTSGHSAFSRAAAEVLTELTGSAWFPGGLASYTVSADGSDFTLGFEYGPSQPVTLQWATYYDAADEAGQSRIWGGIHPVSDDYPARWIGAEVGVVAVERALDLFGAPVGQPRQPVSVPSLGAAARLTLAALLALLGASVWRQRIRRLDNGRKQFRG